MRWTLAILILAVAAGSARSTLPGGEPELPGQPPYDHPWLERIQDWEQVLPELRGFGMLLANLELTGEQMAALDELSLGVERQLEELRSEYDLSGTRRAVFEAFADDMYMSSSVEMAIWDRQWFQQDALHLVTDAMGEINELLTEEQLQTARSLIDRVPELGPPPGEPWPVSPKMDDAAGRR
jgi:hypothetical protein